MDKLLTQLLNEKDDSKIFSLITLSDNNQKLSWSNILTIFNLFLSEKKIYKKTFWGKDLDILKRFGFDIDYEDSSGHTLLFYIFSENKSHQLFSFKYHDILKESKKIYHITHSNENILFFISKQLHEIDWNECKDFTLGQNLIDFIESFPQFDIHQRNNLNRNLFNHILSGQFFPTKLFDYLVEKKVSISHIDNHGYNLLLLFPLITFNEESSKRFLFLCQHNDILHENKYNDSCISLLISFVAQIQNNNHDSHFSWLSFIANNIINGEIPVHNKKKLIHILENSEQEFSDRLTKFNTLRDKTLKFLEYSIFNEQFPAKNIKISKSKL